MKKIISILLVVLMLASTVAMLIPVSAEMAVYTPDFKQLSYKAYKTNGGVCDTAAYDAEFRMTITEALAAKRLKAGSLAAAYVATTQFTINENTHYEYEVKVRNNAESRYAGVVFAISPENQTYFAYGTYDNVCDESDTKSYIITAYGNFDYKFPTPVDEKADIYYKSLALEPITYGINKGNSIENATLNFATLKFVYQGTTVKVLVKDTSGNFVQIGTNVTVKAGSKLAIGIFSRDGENNENRTVAITQPKITAMNTESVNIMKAAGVTVTELRDPSDLEAKIDEINTTYYDDAPYTAESWNALQKGIEDAEALIADSTSTNKDFADCIEILDELVAGLELAELDTSELEAIIAEVAKIKGEKLHSDGQKYADKIPYKMLMARVTDGQNLLDEIEDGIEHTQADVKAAYEQIKAKKEAFDLQFGKAPYEDEQETEKQPESETEKQPESETQKQPESETEKQPESETQKQPESESEIESEIESEPESESESESETEKKPSTDKKPSKETEKESETKKKGIKVNTGCGAAVATSLVAIGIVSALGTALVVKKKD